MNHKTVHVAAENPDYRASLKSTLQKFGIGDLIETSREGAEGVIAVRDTRPEILIVCCNADEDAVEHLQWYREAAPKAYIIGFAFSEDEARGLRRAKVDRVVMSNITRGDLIDVFQNADRCTG